MTKINKKLAAEWAKVKSYREAKEWTRFYNKLSKTHDVEIHPVEEDIFGDGIPRCITVIRNKTI